MINYQKIYGLIGIATKAGKITAGSEACFEAIEKRAIKLILIAEDAADRTKKQFKEKCIQFQIPVYEISSIENLSKAIGKVNKAVLGIKEKGLAQAIIKNINGGV